MNTVVTIIIVCVVAFYFLTAKIIPFFTKMRRVFSKFHTKKNSAINDSQYRKILLGAIYSEQQGAYINALETGLGKAHIQETLGEWWGVRNKLDALDTLNYLESKGFRYYFPVVYEAFQCSDKSNQGFILQSAFGNNSEDLEKAYSQLDNLKETFNELKDDKVINNEADIERLGNIGWDVGRLVFVSRLCYEATYITETEAWHFIEKANLLAKTNFSNWNDFAKSYVLGRGMWGGKGSHNSGIASIAEYLMTDPKSPWLTHKW